MLELPKYLANHNKLYNRRGCFMSALSILCAARKQRQRLGYLNWLWCYYMPEYKLYSLKWPRWYSLYKYEVVGRCDDERSYF